MPTKKKDAKVPTLVRIPLLRPIDANEDQFFQDLRECAYACDIARTKMVRRWIRFREDYEGIWEPDYKTKKDGSLVTTKDGRPILVNCYAPQKVTKFGFKYYPEDSDEEPDEEDPLVNFKTALYHHGRKFAPEVHTSIISMISKEIKGHIQKKAKYRPGCFARHEWEAIMLGESQAPAFSGRNIPVPQSNNLLQIGWDDCYWVKFPMWSRAREPHGYRVECGVKKMRGTYKKLVEQAAAGELELGDSEIGFGKRFWELRLVVYREKVESTLDKKRILRIRSATGENDRPFIATLPGEGLEIEIGRGIPLKLKHEQVTMSRKRKRASRRLGYSKGGHGRVRALRSTARDSRSFKGAQLNFCKDLAEIVRTLAIQNNCGIVRYDQPSINKRDKTWFAANDTPFDWTQQLAKLQGLLGNKGIELSTEDVESAEAVEAEEEMATTLI